MAEILAALWGVLLPALVLVPVVIALVRQAQRWFDALSGVYLFATSILVGVALVSFLNYVFAPTVADLQVMPLGQVVSVGVLVGLQASGIVDLTKIFSRAR